MLGVKFSDHFNFKVNESEYRAGWSFPYDFPFQALRTFDLVLESILFEEIREKRALTYHIGSGYFNYQDVYKYTIAGRVNPDAASKINDLVRMCISQIPSRRDVFDRKLNLLKQKCLMSDVSGESLASNSSDEIISDQRIITLKETLDELSRVSFEQIVEASNILSSDRQYTFIASP